LADDERPIAVLVDREGLGDAMLKVPFLRAVRRAFPDRPVWWIATHQTAMEDELRPLFADDIAHVIAHAGLKGAPAEVLPRLRALPAFARVFDSRTQLSAVRLARQALRCDGFYCCLPGFLLCDGTLPFLHGRPRNVADRMLALIRPATGDPPDPSGWLEPSPAAREAAQGFLPDGQTYVGIAPGSREAIKNWPLERFLEVARALIAQGLTPVFRLGPMETDIRQRVESGAPGALISVADLEAPPGQALDQLIAQAKRFSLLLANDNGVGHLVGGAGTPVISLFGPTDSRRWAPYAPDRRILRAQDFGGREMSAIPTSAAVAAVGEMLRRGVA